MIPFLTTLFLITICVVYIKTRKTEMRKLIDKKLKEKQQTGNDPVMNDYIDLKYSEQIKKLYEKKD